MSEEIQTASEKLKHLVTLMIFKDSYWGYLFSSIRRISNESLPSIMGVGAELDGSITLYYHPKLVEGSEEKEVLLVLEHEGMHILNKHLSRSIRMMANELDEKNKPYKQYVWNLASDCAANELMKMPESLNLCGTNIQVLHPKVYNLKPGRATEIYYEELLKKIKKKKSCMSCSGAGSKKGQDGEGDQDGQGSKKESEDCKNCEGRFVDDHGCWTKNTDQCPDLNSLSRKIEQNIANAALDAYKQVKNRGTLPAGVADLISDLLEPPKVPYYEIIKKLVKGSRLSKFRIAYNRINKKRTYMFTMKEELNLPMLSPFPGKRKDFSFKIAVLIDTSGSMSNDDIYEALSGIKDVVEHDRNCQTTVFECDAKVQKEYKVKRISDIQFDVKGRGGTELFPALDKCRETNTDVTLAFTDGYCDNINEIERRLLPKKIIWVITPNGVTQNIDRTGFVVTLHSNT